VQTRSDTRSLTRHSLESQLDATEAQSGRGKPQISQTLPETILKSLTQRHAEVRKVKRSLRMLSVVLRCMLTRGLRYIRNYPAPPQRPEAGKLSLIAFLANLCVPLGEALSVRDAMRTNREEQGSNRARLAAISAGTSYPHHRCTQDQPAPGQHRQLRGLSHS
jgi:hypothetical protein